MSEPAQLYLLISGRFYRVESIQFGPNFPAKGWKLTKFDDTQEHGPYCVIRQPSGRITCECADFMLVKQKEGGVCKHITALVDIFGESL